MYEITTIDTMLVDTSAYKMFFHRNCSSNEVIEYETDSDFCLHCWNCMINFSFSDPNFLAPIYNNRPVIYYQDEKILRIIDRNYSGPKEHINYSSPCTIQVDRKDKKSAFYFKDLRIFHECDKIHSALNHNDTLVSTCQGCNREFDFNNLSLLAAVFNAALYNISTEVKLYNIGDFSIKPKE
jgi:hypothetical protein